MGIQDWFRKTPRSEPAATAWLPRTPDEFWQAFVGNLHAIPLSKNEFDAWDRGDGEQWEAKAQPFTIISADKAKALAQRFAWDHRDSTMTRTGAIVKFDAQAVRLEFYRVGNGEFVAVMNSRIYRYDYGNL